jgi:hypothetical protein
MLIDLSLLWGKQTVSLSITQHLNPVVISEKDRRITLPSPGNIKAPHNDIPRL